ncbi:MAG: hypothetical protein AAFZ65_08140 [Planctomycetota bacterium]
MRRHRLASAAAAIALLSLVAGTTASTVFALRSSRAAERARQAGLEQERAATAARAAAEEAERARAELAELSMDFVFEFALPIADLPGATEVRAELLRRGLTHLEGLESQLLQDVDDSLRLVRAQIHLGDVLGGMDKANLGDFDGRAAAHEQAWRLIETVAARYPEEPQLATYRSSVLSRQGRACLDRGDLDGAAEYFEAALEEARARRDGDRVPSDLADDLAQALSNYGQLRGLRGDHDFALEAFEAALALRRALRDGDPQSPGCQLRLGHTLAQTGAALGRQGQADRSEARYRAALAAFDEGSERWPDKGSFARAAAETHAALASAMLPHDRGHLVLEVTAEGLERVAALEALDPADTGVHRLRGDLCFSRARAHESLAEGAEVAEPFRAALEQALAEFDRSRAAFTRLRDLGAMLPRESGYFAVIDAAQAAVRDQLEVGPGTAPSPR